MNENVTTISFCSVKHTKIRDGIMKTKAAHHLISSLPYPQKNITTRSIPKFKRQENNKTERKLKLRKHISPYIIDDQNK